MLTKYEIEIDGVKTEVPSECLKNWDEVTTSYKRQDFSGVIRSISSQFEFVGDMYDKLMKLYLRDGVNAEAILSVYTITNNWEWALQFECPLDFSTLKWDGCVLSINCVDNSLGAVIKANKSTKYEAGIDTDDIKTEGTGACIEANKIFTFNRLPVQNSLTYGYSGGESNDDGSINVKAENGRFFMGVVNNEVIINGSIKWNEDQEDNADSYMFTAIKDVDLKIDVEVTSNQTQHGASSTYVSVYNKDGGHLATPVYISIGNKDNRFGLDKVKSEQELKRKYPKTFIASFDGIYYADVNGIIWEVVKYKEQNFNPHWESTGKTYDTYKRKIEKQSTKIHLSTGDKIVVGGYGETVRVYSSKFIFSWFDKGDPISAPAFTPLAVGQHLLNRICLGHTNAILDISAYDSRLQNTLLLAAESIRGIPGAKLYTSFNEFAEWISVVFGYTYYIDDDRRKKFTAIKNAFAGNTDTPYPINQNWDESHTEPPTEDDIMYLSAYDKFVAYDGHEWYEPFPGSDEYNNIHTGHARTDVVFKMKRYVGDGYVYDYYVFDSDLKPYVGNIEDYDKPFQTVHFVHRSEIFRKDAPVHQIDSVRDMEYSVDMGQIYSSVNIGYEKKDYENTNGRDEFNFNNTYSTGCTLMEKTLTMKSKYRADCYGIEFAAQDRGKDTTDSNSDKDVFFVLCTETESGTLIPDTSIKIDNAISDEVFNGAFSPMACVEANKGYIGIQSTPLNLKFTSSEGNSDIIIGGQPMTADITLDEPLFTCGKLEFLYGEPDEKIEMNELIEVESNGITYRGFIEEARFNYAEEEAVKYKLLVKDIEPWY